MLYIIKKNMKEKKKTVRFINMRWQQQTTTTKKAATKKTKKVKQVCCPSLLFCGQALVKFLLPDPRSRSLLLSQSFSRST